MQFEWKSGVPVKEIVSSPATFHLKSTPPMFEYDEYFQKYFGNWWGARMTHQEVHSLPVALVQQSICSAPHPFMPLSLSSTLLPEPSCTPFLL